MAETPPGSPPRTPPRSVPDSDSIQYWCYNCEKRVAVETLPDQHDIVCFECKDGFVETISVARSPAAAVDVNLGDQFFQVIRLIAQAREQNAPPPPPSDPSEDDYLRFELEGWDEEDEDEEDDDDDDDEQSVVVAHAEEDNQELTNGEEEEENEVIEPTGDDDDDDDEEEEEARRRRRDVLRLRLRDFATRAGSQRNRILDWAEILMGLEDHSIELRLHGGGSDSDTYVGNPGDYVDAAGYEALLQNLADTDGGRRGAPPASKSAVDKLENVLIDKEEDVMGCAICKDSVSVGELAKNMPCGHGYHGDCIVTWLLSRNSCPVCRFELPTDDAEYEEEKKKRLVDTNLTVGSTSSASADQDSGGLH